MPRDVARDTLYNGQINLWVEDDLTRAYLDAVWNDPSVKFLIGGGYNGVVAILKDAEEAGYTNVFGVVDGDHGRSNYSEWFVPGRTFRRFILPRHEIENYLLDTAALEGCRLNTHRRTADEIVALLRAEAAKRCWASACRDVVMLIRNRFFDGFINQPKLSSVDSEMAAQTHILQSDWVFRLDRKSRALTEVRVSRLLKWAHARASRKVQDSSWRIDFPGKEIFHVVGQWVFKSDPASRSSRPTQAEFYSDLAKLIAAWQVANATIPNELSDLLAALKARTRP